MTAETTAMTPTVVSPWMTAAQAAIYSGRHRETLYLALHEYVSSSGRRGLRGVQPGRGCSWRIRTDDLDAWLNGAAPRKRRPS